MPAEVVQEACQGQQVGRIGWQPQKWLLSQFTEDKLVDDDNRIKENGAVYLLDDHPNINHFFHPS